MKRIKVIKTEEDYLEALNLVGELMNLDPNPDSEEGEQVNEMRIDRDLKPLDKLKERKI